jgi:hypothetical protein
MPSPKRGVGYTFTATFIDSLTKDFRLGPTIVAGDVKVQTDNGSYANITTLPASVAGEPDVEVVLSPAEMLADKTVKVWFKDQTVPSEWDQFVVTIEPSLQIMDDVPIGFLDVAVSLLLPKGAVGTPGAQGTHTPSIYTLKYRDTGPSLEIILRDPAAPGSPPGTVGPVHPLPGGATYKLHIKLNNGTTLTRDLERVTPDTDGHVRYQPVAADWTDPTPLIIGPVPPLKPSDVEHLLEVEELNGTSRLTFPNGGYDILRVFPDLGQGS